METGVKLGYIRMIEKGMALDPEGKLIDILYIFLIDDFKREVKASFFVFCQKHSSNTAFSNHLTYMKVLYPGIR